MKLNNSPACAPSNNQAARAMTGRAETPPRAEQRGTRDAFERALHAKAQPLATDEQAAPVECALHAKAQPLATDDEQESTAPEATLPAGAVPMMAWVCVPLVRASEAPHHTAPVVETATGTRAAIEAALQNAEPQDCHPLAATERPAVWEASIGGLHGTVELRAERIVANGVPPSWGVTIGAPAFGADVAARHTSKLHERLRKHGIDVDHVRIERKRERDDPPR